MRRNAGPELSQCHRMFERSLHGRYTFAVELDKVPRNNLALLPASQVCQQARWDRHRRLPLVSLPPSLGASVVDATFKVDKGPPHNRRPRCLLKCARARAPIDLHKDLTGEDAEGAAIWLQL